MTPKERQLAAQVKELRRQLDKLQEANLTFEEVRAKILRLAETPPPPPRNWLAPPSKTQGNPGVPTLLLSDLHYGERVAKEEAYGNAFDKRIAKIRVGNVVWRAIDLIKNHMVGDKPQTLIVPILGDIVTGEIHDELTKTNDGSLLPAIPEAVDLLFNALTTLADQLNVNVFAPCTAGNHGRNTRKLEAKRFTASNFDWLIYVLLERRIMESPWRDRIRVRADASNEARWTVFDHRYLGLHGHDLGVKGGDGLIGALGPIMRGRLKVLAQQRAAGYEIDTLVLGHWHQYLTLPGLIVNGSIKGYDEFAAKVLRAPPTPPVQALWYTHPEHGVTCHWPVFAR